MSRAAAAACVVALALAACAHGIEEGTLGEPALVASGAGGAASEPLGGSAGMGGASGSAAVSETSGSGPGPAGSGGALPVAGAGTSAGGASAGAGGSGGASGAGGAAGKAGAGGTGGGAPLLGPDITASGTPIAFMLTPTGGGNHDIEVLRDNDMPPLDSMDS